MGVAESPMWHRTAPMEVKIAHFQKACLAYGHKPDTPEMATCLQSAMQSSAGNANALMGAIHQANQQNFQNNRAVTCNTLGTTTTCR